MLDRPCRDIDFATTRGAGNDIERLLGEAGYEPDRQFNAINGRDRLLLVDPAHSRQVDVFVGSFRMCHEIPLTKRLVTGQPTIPLAELLLISCRLSN